jgi:hypothetical protein
MTIETGKYRLRIGWRFVLRWRGIVRAASTHYPHATIRIGPFLVARW